MARAIKETPVLTGEHAERFEREIKANEQKKVPREQYQRAVELFHRVNKAARS